MDDPGPDAPSRRAVKAPMVQNQACSALRNGSARGMAKALARGVSTRLAARGATALQEIMTHSPEIFCNGTNREHKASVGGSLQAFVS